MKDASSEIPPTEEHPPVFPDRVWWKSPELRKLNFCVLSLLLLSSSSGFDGSLVNGLEDLDSWVSFMGHPTTTWLGSINAIYWIGGFVSTSLAAWICNIYGRKIGIYMGVTLLLAGTILGTAAPNGNAYLGSRVLVGCGFGWIGSSAPLLLNEIAWPPHRGVSSALFMVGYYVGAVISSWATFATRTYTTSWAWRLPTLLQFLCPLIAIPGVLFVPESPRWLISQGRVEEARQVLANLHANNDTTSPFITYEVLDIQGAITAEKEAASSTGYADMFKTPGNRRRLFITVTLGLFAQWSGNGVVSYYLAMVLDTVGITNTRDQLLISACLQVWNVIFATIGASSVERFGRRKLFGTSAVVMLASYIIITGLSRSFDKTGSAGIGTAVIPFLFVYFAGYDIVLTPMLTAYPCEIWPFGLRSRGLNILWLSSISATIFNTFANPIALGAIGWKYYIVFVVVLCFYAIIPYFFYPETRGYSLEHVARIFDGEDAVGPSGKEVLDCVVREGGEGEEEEEKAGSVAQVERV
ncbi:general substrate transporter [Aspergillus sclerotiicarbonarius CBS 121057]|uniref:General substrate transporter n=1 Tax=Aspergillus sclerotiicarbonarius (strain CBS 121057 / IBT 28362) TaxID=1448318 RepID=A0A319E0G2_ASPSB|nr:general substrate transporter [Aspergillus sclerotiicarbonarius CBS 121057]